MSSEVNFRKWVIKSLKLLDAVAVENPARAGTPDVNYVEGWIELKVERRWPVKDDTPLRLKKYTDQQKTWLRRRWSKGGNCFLLLQVGREILLFRGEDAHHIGTLPRAQLRLLACRSWNHKPSKEVLIAALDFCGQDRNVV